MRAALVSFCGLAAAVAVGATLTAQSPRPGGKTVWHGVFTDAQASRGQTEYSTNCSNNCHREDLSGYNSVLFGQRFMEKYREASLHLLFDKIKSTMPRGAPASLSDRQYTDIVAYLLQANEFPAGADELTTDALPSIQLVGKEGPEPVPDFSLVRVVGCLIKGPADANWRVTNASEPRRAGNPKPDEAERSAAASQPLGATTFRLLVSPAYKPDQHAGGRVEVRGFLIRRSDESRINITSLETLAPSCGN